METKMMPHNLEAETAVLGSILLDWKMMAKVTKILKVEDFYSEKHQIIYRAMLDLFKGLKPIDILTLADRLEAKKQYDAIDGAGYLAGLVNSTPVAFNAPAYARIVAKTSKLRKIILIGHKIAEKAYDSMSDPASLIEETGKALIDTSDTNRSEEAAVGQILGQYNELQEEYSEAFKNGKRILGTSTGFSELDAMTEGIREAHLWIIGGYSSVGKTYFSLNILKSLLEQGKRCVYYSLEMSQIDIVSRLLAITTKMPPQYLLKGMAKPDEYGTIQSAKKWLESTDLTIHSDLHKLSEIRLSIIEEMMKKRVDCFFLDYVQLVSSTGKEYDDMRLAATEFQELMKKLKVPMVMLSQLSNEAARNPSAMVIGFKGAGNLVHAADYGIELWPGEKDVEQYRKKLAEGQNVYIKCQVKKNRQGRTGTVYLSFNSYTGTFEEVNNYSEYDTQKPGRIDTPVRTPYKER